MKKVTRIARIGISLPGDLLRAVENERRSTGESRSEFVRRAVTDQLAARARRRAIERYVRGYAEHPESAEEIRAEGTIGVDAIAEEPWE